MREAKERAFQPGLFGGPRELPIELPSPMPDRVLEDPLVRRFAYTVSLEEEEQAEVYGVARKVARRYEKGHDEGGRVARMKWALPPGMSFVDLMAQGFGAEKAVSVWSGLPWNEGKRGKPDVGKNVEVRQTKYSDGLLVLKSFDHLARIFILAIGRFPTYYLAGWIPGAEGVAIGRAFMAGESVAFREGGQRHASSSGGWIIAQDKLRPMSALEVRR